MLLFYKTLKNIFKTSWTYDFPYSNTNKPWINKIFNIFNCVDFILGQCFLPLLTLVLESITWPWIAYLKIIKRKYRGEIKDPVSWKKKKVVLFWKHKLCIGKRGPLMFIPKTLRIRHEPQGNPSTQVTLKVL